MYQIHLFLEWHYMFRAIFPSIIRSSRLSWTADDGQKDRPKHVECHSKINKFDTLVHLVGFTIEILLVGRCSSLASNWWWHGILLDLEYTEVFKMIVGFLPTCHTQYTWDMSICVFLFNRKHAKFLLHTLQVLYTFTLCDSTGLFKMIVEVLSTCHTQYT